MCTILTMREPSETDKSISLNIPDAKHIYNLCHVQEQDREKQITLKQQQIIEKTFNEYKGDCDIIEILLDEKLRDSLVKQLVEKGYSVHQTSVYDSENSSQNGKWVLRLGVKPKKSEYIRYVGYKPNYITPYCSFMWY